MGAASYPHAAGFRATDTSEAAAEAMTPSVAYLQGKALDAIRRKPLTSWEAAQATGIPFEALQPRFSELRALGLVEDSGERGAARSPRHTAIRWRVVPMGLTATCEPQRATAEGGSR